MTLLIVGEYLSAKEAEEGGPFRGGLGKMFKSWMSSQGLNPRDSFFTHVLMTPPKRDTMLDYCGPKELGIPGMKALQRGHYLRKEFQPDLERLWSLVNERRPNLVLAVGDLALWALTSEKSLKNSRGRITHGHSGIPNRKVLPVYSPRQIMGDYSLRPILLADLAKAAREMEFPEIRRPRRFIHLRPSLEDLEQFYQDYIEPSPYLDADIETKGTIITCVGFAPSPDRALVIPFFDEEKPDGNYWPTPREEYMAWQFVRRMFRLPKSLCGQNFQYDMQYLWRQMGIKTPSFSDDTMLLHHALQPEMQKGLGFLGSIYTDELSWKFMHKVSTEKSAKKGDLE